MKQFCEQMQELNSYKQYPKFIQVHLFIELYRRDIFSLLRTNTAGLDLSPGISIY